MCIQRGLPAPSTVGARSDRLHAPQLTPPSLKFKGDKTSVGKKRKRVAGESSDAVAKRNKDKVRPAVRSSSLTTQAVPEFDESDMDGWMDLAEPEACVRARCPSMFAHARRPARST